MSTSADGSTENGAQVAGSSMHDSVSQLDDDCVSENSFGSYFSNNAMDEENMTADIELDSLPQASVSSDEEYPQSTSIVNNMYLRSPSVVPQYTPQTRSTQVAQPAFNTEFLGQSMCVVRGLIFNLVQHWYRSINMLGLQTFTRLQ